MNQEHAAFIFIVEYGGVHGEKKITIYSDSVICVFLWLSLIYSMTSCKASMTYVVAKQHPFCFETMRSQLEFIQCHLSLCLHVRRILYRSGKSCCVCHMCFLYKLNRCDGTVLFQQLVVSQKIMTWNQKLLQCSHVSLRMCRPFCK
jgi:hypothetical protein